MKHVLRMRTLQGFAPVPDAERPPHLAIRHLGSNERYEQPVRWDAAGIATGEWTIPREAKLGAYEVVMLRPERKKKPGNYTPKTGVKINHPLRPKMRRNINAHVLKTIKSTPRGAQIRMISWNVRSKPYRRALRGMHARLWSLASGVLDSGCMPSDRKCCRVSGCAMKSTSAPLSRATIAPGRFAGATTHCQEVAS